MNAAEAVLAGSGGTTAWQEELYKDLHRHPELSMQESRTAATITERLAAFGYEVKQVGGGVVGVLANGEGRNVLYRADFDALPVTEDTGLEYSSTVQGVMHACGHDMHVVAALGAAELLAARRDAWSGTYIALFQPGEETAAGARSMVEAGLADQIPHPDVAMAQHVLTKPGAGHVGTAAGPVLSAGDSIRITVFGKGSHGSMPQLGVDPVVLAASIVIRLQTIVSREISPSDFGVVTVGSLQAGSKSNIIPDRAELLLNLRTYDTAVREKIVAAVERIVRAECEASGSPQEPTFEYYDQYPLTSNDVETNTVVTSAFVQHFGADRVEHLDPITASEDFSNIPDQLGVPYVYWGLGGFLPGMPVFPNHNPRFAPAIQPTLATGTEAVVVAAMAYLGKN
ncbi:hippurate hydrolase [Raineyella antarctica]|uniref:Hippurate hydrolase n=1 Tax=Raineyella antarctica TaxID=1577474 RepID=A0A1G6GDD1_9ACTN|nr:amidohydrolase [Raineyella antarctica]SDB80008.1 hippurate hydrolase [Raineyella antarctica]